jgi:hypothetical protein
LTEGPHLIGPLPSSPESLKLRGKERKLQR